MRNQLFEEQKDDLERVAAKIPPNQHKDFFWRDMNEIADELESFEQEQIEDEDENNV